MSPPGHQGRVQSAQHEGSPVNRWRSRIALVLPALAIVAVAVAINVWVVSHPWRIDLTSGGVYSDRKSVV